MLHYNKTIELAHHIVFWPETPAFNSRYCAQGTPCTRRHCYG